MHRSHLAPLLVLLAGCEARQVRIEIVTDFDLQLVPITPADQAPFQGDVTLTLLADSPGVRETLPLGSADDSIWTLDGLDPLDDTRLGLLLTAPGASIDPIDPADVLAWGRTPPITASTGSLVMPVIVSTFGRIAEMGALEGSRIAHGAAIAALPDGDVLLFGGTEAIASGGTAIASSSVQRLDRTDEALVFATVGYIPELFGDDAGRIWATATPVDTPDGTRVLVAGGRPSFTLPGNAAGQGFLWDPATHEVVWDAPLPAARSQHLAFTVATGDVLLVGGLNGSGQAPPSSRLTFDWFRVGELAFEEGGQVTETGVGSLHLAIADLGVDGVMTCGGGITGTALGNDVLAPQQGCVRIGTDNATFPLPDLPDGPRLGHGMTTLASGLVLMTGGVQLPPSLLETSPAVATAWVFDPDPAERTWTAVGDMVSPRAGHVLVALSDGRAMVVGGSDLLGFRLSTALGNTPFCPEIFDPDTGSFSLDDGCSQAARGVFPRVASSPGYGAFILAGSHDDGGGDVWGLVNQGPSSGP